MTDDNGTGDATSPANTTTSSATDDTTTSDATSSSATDKSDDGLGDPARRALTAERERVKTLETANAQMRDRLAELEDAGKSEVERARNALEREKKRADEAELRLADLERGRARQRIAQEVGLPLELAERIVGDDDRALRADAKRLLDLTQPPDGRLGAGRGGVTPARVADDMNARIREATGRG